MRAIRAAIAIVLFVLAPVSRSAALDGDAPINDRQLMMMMFVDYGRSYGYQSMMAVIQIDTIKAELKRDRELLKRKEELFRRKAIPKIELEIAQLKDTWNSKQLIVVEKSLIVIVAQYEAMKEMAKHFGGVPIPVASLYEIFRRGWDAGCEKGPDEVVAMKAWAAYARKAAERARELNSKGNESLASLLEKEAQLTIAQSNYEQRQVRLDRCRSVLFPSLEDVLAIQR